MSLPALKLKKNEERRLRSGHLWVYSNEVDTAATPLTHFEPGTMVQLQDYHGGALGTAYVNPHTLICARLVSRDPEYTLDKSLLVHRLNIALALRERYFDQPYYRLVFGEADALPGLIIDRFGATLVLQITTAGMERVKQDIVEALHKVIKPEVIILRNDTAARDTEGLTQSVEVLHGPEPECIGVLENGVHFEVAALTGQKTGWFYDHRTSRARLLPLVREQRVLDVFSYVGGWGVQAAHAGASEVICIDSSAPALEFVHRNAALNQLEDKVATIQGDVFEALQALREAKEKFDVIVLDPPAFIKRKKDHAKGMQAYQRLNQLALQLMNKDSLLVSASCSYHLSRDELRTVMLKASRHIDRQMQIIEQGHQGPDHPVHPAIPETDYLKTFFARVYRG